MTFSMLLCWIGTGLASPIDPLAPTSLTSLIAPTLSGTAALQTEEPEPDPKAPPAPLPAVPSERQRAWHQAEYYGFIHFGPNTFTGVEWGAGTEQPDVFQPINLDCRQWARTAKEVGMSGLILTAKHHDGFCLWPSEQTDHSVGGSSWRGGQGDVLGELAEACKEFDLKLGVYLSPWDRHEPSYGNSEAYNDFFVAQLEEVLGNYGELFEVWFDGACGEGPNGKRQEYDWSRFVRTVRELQPNAVIFSDDGPDVRWVGNERGFAGETNWSTVNRENFAPGSNRKDLTEGTEGAKYWIPAEADVSIRPGWFHTAADDRHVKSAFELEDIYMASVGRNASLNLNVPPNSRGLWSDEDVASLRGLHSLLQATYDEDMAQGAKVNTSNVRAGFKGGADLYGGRNAVDHDPSTYWATDDDILSASIEVDLLMLTTINRVELREFIELGQRISAFTVEAYQGDRWIEIAAGTTVGRRRLLKTAPTSARRFRFNITNSLACPALSHFGLFLAPPRVAIESAGSDFVDRQIIQLKSDLPEAKILYTLDGSDPNEAATQYMGPITLAKSATVKAIASFEGQTSPLVVEQSFRRHDDRELLTAIQFIRAPDSGLSWQAVLGTHSSLEQVFWEPLEAKGVVPNLNLSVLPTQERVAVRYSGFVRAPKKGVYQLHLTSDDGSRLWIGERLVVDNDGLHGMETRSGSVGLQAGWHPFRLEAFNATGEFGLQLEWTTPGSARMPLGNEFLFH